MKHSQLLEHMANELGSRSAAREALEAFLRAMWLGLHRDGKVEVREFGVIELQDQPSRVCESINDGRLIETRPSVKARFRLSKPLLKSLRAELEKIPS